MHLFLTGPLQCGKTTIIQKVCASFPGAIGGFRTFFTLDRAREDRVLYLCGANESPREENAVVHFTPSGPLVHTERFDAIGARLLEEARNSAELILMDECGRFERDALAFQREVFQTLQGSTPVLGVLRQDAGGWLDEIRSHPRVQVWTVSVDNRDALPGHILSLLCASRKQ